jgi:hypothetical protein
LQATEQPGELAKVNLPIEYLRGAGDPARRRIAAAGVRLGAVIQALPISPADLRRVAETPLPVSKPSPLEPTTLSAVAGSPATSPPVPTSGSGEEFDPALLTHWLNLNGNVRHNSTCRNFMNTKKGRMCAADEGRPCGLCGG